MFTFFHLGEAREGRIETGQYVYGGMAVQLVADDEDYATLSVYVRGPTLAADEFIFKTYSENEGLLESLLAAGVVSFQRHVQTSFGTAPVCRLCG